MARGANLIDVHNFASELIDQKFRSSLYDMPVLFTALAHKGGVIGKLGDHSKDTGMVIGGARGMGSKMRLVNTTGSTQRQIRFHYQRTAAVKYMGTDDTTASTGTGRQDKNFKSAYVSWAILDAAIAIRNSTLRKAKGKYELASPVELAVDEALADLYNQIGSDVYSGSPSDQTEEDWDSILGLQSWIHNSNTVGGIDRSSVSGFSGNRVTTSKPARLSLIDEANLDFDGSGNGVANKGGKIDLVITTNSNYKKLKDEALAAGYIIQKAEVPDTTGLGQKMEGFEYNGAFVTFDPKAPASSLFALDSRSVTLEVMGGENFRVTKLVDLSEDGPPGSPDLTTGHVRVGLRLSVDKPFWNVQYTAIS